MTKSTNYKEDYLHGKNGIVWATYNLQQAETIQSALIAQNIWCDVLNKSNDESEIHLLIIKDEQELQIAIDFVWREKSGLCLRPDWTYPVGKENTSFKKWLSAI